MALDVVCRDVTSPVPVMLHGRCSGGGKTADFYYCISPFFFPSYIQNYHSKLSAILFTDNLPNILHYAILRWTGSSCSFNK